MTIRGHLTNLSLGGALIDLAVGTIPPEGFDFEGEVVVELEIGGCGWVAQRGHVRRCDAGQLAIAFGQVGPDVEDVIEDEVIAAVEARRSPRVVVVDPREERRHEVAERLRASGLTSMEVATPLEAIALVEQQRNHVAAVAMADTLTQTGPHELVEFLSESNPHIKLAMFAEEDHHPSPSARPGGVPRHDTSEELATSIAASLRRERP